ncbi:YqjK family protein [Halomonas cerina]|uniref:YqjK-like protein n=1 Tax=Halomonas cerina TaxID=447424 RepID=A0A839V0G8_9GAMM|nr:hypothetical protein [Halomonas cerina]
MTRRDRQRHKAELEHLIEQQRVDLLVAADQWQMAGGAIDAGWHKLMRYKVPLLTAGGVLLYRGVRRPRNIRQLVQHLSTVAVAYKAVKRLLD